MLTKRLGIVAMSIGIACGCTEGVPGGPGVHNVSETQIQTTNKPVIDDAKDTFSLKPPLMTTSLKQGESKNASIAIQRGSQFKGDVRLVFSNIPTGVTVEPLNPVIKSGEKDVEIQLSADHQASAGDYRVSLRGQSSEGGAEALSDLKISISAK